MAFIFKMKKNKKNSFFLSHIIKNFLFIFILFMINENYSLSFYIIPFKYFKNSSLRELNNNSKNEELFLNNINKISLYTSLKINDFQRFEGFIESKPVCISITDKTCISNREEYSFSNNYNYTNISIIFDEITKYSKSYFESKECISGVLGFGIPKYSLSDDCISIVQQIKKIDSTIKTYTWSLRYFNSSERNNYGYDGEIIIGIEPHNYLPYIFNESNYQTIYNFQGSDYYSYDYNSEYRIQFEDIYFYKDNNISLENIIKCYGPQSMDGYFQFDLGMIQSSYDYFYLIKNNFFNKYIDSGSCKEIIFSGIYHTFICNKNKLNIKEFYKNFPSIFFKKIDLNYIFELSYKDVFMEENDTLYFMIYSSDSNMLKWYFGEIFLQKYYFTFNPDENLIGFYLKKNNNENEEDINNDSGDKNNLSNKNEKKYIIIIVIAIFLFIIEAIFFGICIWKKKCLKDRRKRANELNDDNYDYLASNSDNKRIINEN